MLVSIFMVAVLGRACRKCCSRSTRTSMTLTHELPHIGPLDAFPPSGHGIRTSIHRAPPASRTGAPEWGPGALEFFGPEWATSTKPSPLKLDDSSGCLGELLGQRTHHVRRGLGRRWSNAPGQSGCRRLRLRAQSGVADWPSGDDDLGGRWEVRGIGPKVSAFSTWLLTTDLNKAMVG